MTGAHGCGYAWMVVCMAGGCAWLVGVHGWGLCMVGGGAVHGLGEAVHAWGLAYENVLNQSTTGFTCLLT